MSDDYVEEDMDDYNGDELEYEDDEEDVNDIEDLNLIDDNNTNIFDISQFYNKNDYETITKLEAELSSTEKQSSTKITKYEYAKVIGVRAQELANGSPAFVETDGMQDVIEIAEKEYKHNKIPYINRRPMPDGNYEYFRLDELRK
jgi:DNA-directed RNA polymerase I, II, and III subunit RPABC2